MQSKIKPYGVALYTLLSMYRLCLGMSREHVSLMSKIGQSMKNYYADEFGKAIKSDMMLFDEPDAMIHLIIMELGAKALSDVVIPIFEEVGCDCSDCRPKSEWAEKWA